MKELGPIRGDARKRIEASSVVPEDFPRFHDTKSPTDKIIPFPDREIVFFEPPVAHTFTLREGILIQLEARHRKL